ncbi:MAG TPA: glycosyltransferase, partial [Terriglobales bacterium]
GLLALFLGVEKVLYHQHIMSNHGPLLIFAAVLILSGVQLLALGLLGDLQVRHFHEPDSGIPYRVAKVLRSDRQGEEHEIR